MVEDYTKKFSNLPIHCQIDKNDRQLLSGYKASLFPKVKREMTIVWVFSIDEVYQMAFKIEDHVKQPLARLFESQYGESASKKLTDSYRSRRQHPKKQDKCNQE